MASTNLRTIKFHAFRGNPKGDHLVKTPSVRNLKPGQAVVRITHSGVCGTDEHFRGQDIALGHEGVGVVEEVFPGITDVKVGDRVGFGFVHWTCGNCETCLKGHDQYCLNREEYITHNRDQGSYGSHVVWYVRNLFVLPDGLESRYAGPLMCGGEAVWGALRSSGRPVEAGEVVGVVGIGGLGHLAIQFASKMGLEVIVFSSSEDKREEAMAFGADKFYVTKGVEKFPDELTKKIDHLIFTTSGQPDFQLYTPIVAPLGVIYPLTVEFGQTPVSMLPLVVEGRSIQGSSTAPHFEIQRMLQFAARHGIKPKTMEWPMTAEGIEAALDTLKAGKMRYRGVVVAQ